MVSRRKDTKAIADGFEIHRWYRAGRKEPDYEVVWEPSEWDDEDDDDGEEQSKTFPSLDDALAFGRSLLETRP